MSLKLALLVGLLSVELELPSDAHDIYSHLRVRTEIHESRAKRRVRSMTEAA
jgi:hypothetical protein